MTVAMRAPDQPRRGLEQPARELRCPACNRFVAAVTLPDGVQAGQSWIRVYCQGCRKFVVIDQATQTRRGGVH
jgi:phage FluMu protein Com